LNFGEATRVGDAIGTAAAILQEIGDEGIHGRVVRAVDQGPVPPLLKDQPSSPQLGQVEGQRAVGHAESVGDRASGHAGVAGLDEQTKQIQPMLLRKSAQGCDSVGRLHGRDLISMNLEMSSMTRPVKHIFTVIEMRREIFGCWPLS
jgi:hypothetical protein